jgi:2-iminobutanoate/2-iminopropanoate deaminase
MKKFNPTEVAPPASSYSHAVDVPGNYRWLHISGQIAVRPDGSIAQGAEAQLEQSWANLMAILRAARMGPEDLVKVTTFLTPTVEVALSRRVRDRHLAGEKPASTLLVVAALANPDFLCEVEAIAAKPA